MMCGVIHRTMSKKTRKETMLNNASECFTIQTVSYTHLDVYKRQVTCCVSVTVTVKVVNLAR